MSVASVRETANFTNKVNAVTPYTLGQVLNTYATQAYVANAISQAVIDPSQIDLSAYAKKTDVPSKLSQLTNDANYVQTVSGLIPSNLLPSYVDDVIEVANYSSLPNPGETGKIYVTLDDNLTYRWGGSGYVEISKSLALGTTSSTAFRGDYGNTAYQHSQATGNPHGLALTDLNITVNATTINYLTGLNKNILTALAEYLPLTGGTLTGYLTLHHDPTQKMHAANKDYVDKEINGISVTVTQHVTQIADLQEGLEGLTSTVGVQAETLTEVQNSLTGVEETTAAHTESIANITLDTEGIHESLSTTQSSVTVLENTIKLLVASLDRDNIVVQIDNFNKPLESKEYIITSLLKFRGNVVPPDDVVITNNNTGITCTYDEESEEISITVYSSTAIPNSDNPITIEFDYTAGGIDYSDIKTINVATIAKGVASASVALESSNGLQFKNNIETTDINAIVYYDGYRITNQTDLVTHFGSGAYLQWKWKHKGDSSYSTISSSDSRLSNNGFTFTLTAQDVTEQVTFMCEVITI